ncbi:hypothetical protein [Roseateles sp. P5_E1]
MKFIVPSAGGETTACTLTFTEVLAGFGEALIVVLVGDPPPPRPPAAWANNETLKQAAITAEKRKFFILSASQSPVEFD